MPRKTKGTKGETETRPSVVGPRRVPDLVDGDNGGMDNPYRLRSVTSKQQKDGDFTRDIELVLDAVPVLGIHWPNRLELLRPFADSASKGGPTCNLGFNPKLECRLSIVHVIDEDNQLPIFLDHPALLRRIKVTGKEDEAGIRYIFRVSDVDDVAQELDNALREGTLCVSCKPIQQPLPLKPRRGSAEALPPEPGELH